MTTSLRELAAKWRASSDAWAENGTTYGESTSITLADCADELEAALPSAQHAVTDEMVERAHCAYWEYDHGDNRLDVAKQDRDSMRAALEAALSTPPAEGMVLVPREPTDAMLEAALRVHGEDAFIARSPALLSALLKIYRAMIAATEGSNG